MAEETTNSQPQGNESVPVTDDMLSSAWDESEVNGESAVETKEDNQQEVTEEQVHEQQIPEEPTDNAERSRLGRRMKSVEDNLNAILSKLENLQTSNVTQEQREQPVQTQVFNPYGNDEDSIVFAEIDKAIANGLLPETIVTPQDQIKVNRYEAQVRAQLKERASLNYTKRYIEMLKGSDLKGDTPDELHDMIIAEMYKEGPFNKVIYNNPEVDARINYLEAKSALMAQGVPKTNNVFKGKTSDVPTSTNATSRVAPTADEMPQLDEYALAYAKSQGMSTETIKKAFKEPLSLHLKGVR